MCFMPGHQSDPRRQRDQLSFFKILLQDPCSEIRFDKKAKDDRP